MSHVHGPSQPPLRWDEDCSVCNPQEPHAPDPITPERVTLTDAAFFEALMDEHADPALCRERNCWKLPRTDTTHRAHVAEVIAAALVEAQREVERLGKLLEGEYRVAAEHRDRIEQAERQVRETRESARERVLHAQTVDSGICSRCYEGWPCDFVKAYDRAALSGVSGPSEASVEARWLDRLEAAAGMGPLAAVAEHQRRLGAEGDHETRLREKRVAELVDLITEAAAFRDDASGVSGPTTPHRRCEQAEAHEAHPITYRDAITSDLVTGECAGRPTTLDALHDACDYENHYCAVQFTRPTTEGASE